MSDREPLWYPSRGPLNPGVPNRQIWAIGMVVIQWGMAEFIRDQSVHTLIGDDQDLITQYKNLRNSSTRSAFWREQVETKNQEPERTQSLGFIVRFQQLNEKRDNIVHRMWGGGIEAGTPDAPPEAMTTDGAMHRARDEKKKTKSKDGRRNLSWRLDFQGLRKIASDIAQLNQDILASWLPSGSTGTYHLWSFLDDEGRLQIGIADAAEAKPVHLDEDK